MAASDGEPDPSIFGSGSRLSSGDRLVSLGLAAALDSVGVTPRETAEFLMIADGLKWDIVETRASPAK